MSGHASTEKKTIPSGSGLCVCPIIWLVGHRLVRQTPPRHRARNACMATNHRAATTSSHPASQPASVAARRRRTPPPCRTATMRRLDEDGAAPPRVAGDPRTSAQCADTRGQWPRHDRRPPSRYPLGQPPPALPAPTGCSRSVPAARPRAHRQTTHRPGGVHAR